MEDKPQMDMSTANETTALAVHEHALHGHPYTTVQYKDEPLDSGGIIPAHQKRAVTASVPLLEIIQRLVYRLHPASSLETVLALIALYKASAPVYEYLKKLLLRLSTSQATVSEYDPVAREILAYMSSEVMAKGRATQAFLVSGNSSQEVTDGYMREMLMHRYGKIAREPDQVQCMPPLGTKLFWVGFRPFIFSRRAHQQSVEPHTRNGTASTTYSITLTTPGWSLKPLEEFVKMCHDLKVKSAGETTTVHFSGGGSALDYGGYNGGAWRSVTKAIRKLDTIDIDENVKSDIITDADEYYSPDTKKFYADCGIPYRRGYLFHGPPGTGKTSFSSALAGHLKCDLYMINLAAGDVSDGKLHSLFLCLPRKCVVVIEDIDSAGIGREQEKTPAPPPQMPLSGAPAMPGSAPQWPPGPHGPARRVNKVTLSGLLNAIDGNASQEGRLLIMTSNNPDALDEALTRPGRIDKKVHFGNMSESAARGIFRRLIGRAAINSGKVTSEVLEQKAVVFAQKLPADAFTPAQVQNYLQSCRGDAEKAINEVVSWAEKNAKSAMTEEAGAAETPAATTVNEDANAMAVFNALANGSDDLDISDEMTEEEFE